VSAQPDSALDETNPVEQDLTYPLVHGGASWPTTPGALAPPPGLGSWANSPRDTTNSRQWLADLALATALLLALVVLGCFYVAGVVDHPHEPGTAPAQRIAPSSKNPFGQ
jgi:hypothetical protein